jgi:hypothetical protein
MYALLMLSLRHLESLKHTGPESLIATGLEVLLYLYALLIFTPTNHSSTPQPLITTGLEICLALLMRYL